MSDFTRRLFVASALAVAPGAALAQTAARNGRLTLVPSVQVKGLPAGLHSLPSGALLFAPSAVAGGEVPLALALHGATQDAQFAIRAFRDAAEQSGVALVAPKSEGVTWDLAAGPIGLDARNIEACLNAALARIAVDRRRLGCAGFSDGASYALSLGLTNGDLFSDVLAFSPGYMKPLALRGRPRVFIAHGREDTILPFEGAQSIVKGLSSHGYDVQFYPFVGGHRPAPAAVAAGFERFAGRGGRR